MYRLKASFAKEIIDEIVAYEKSLEFHYYGTRVKSTAEMNALCIQHTDELNNTLKAKFDLKEDIAVVTISQRYGTYVVPFVTVGLCK